MDNTKFETLTAIVADLKVVKVGLKKMCNRDATLLTAEGTFVFIIREMNQQNSVFSKNLKCPLSRRINERHNVA